MLYMANNYGIMAVTDKEGDREKPSGNDWENEQKND